MSFCWGGGSTQPLCPPEDLHPWSLSKRSHCAHASCVHEELSALFQLTVQAKIRDLMTEVTISTALNAPLHKKFDLQMV